MMQSVRSRLGSLQGLLLTAFGAAMGFAMLAIVQVQNASAAADTVTGIDYSEIGTDVLGSAKPAVVAGVAILVLITAVKLGKKLWNKVSG